MIMIIAGMVMLIWAAVLLLGPSVRVVWRYRRDLFERLVR